MIYLDNSATTRVFDSVKDIVVKAMTVPPPPVPARKRWRP